MAEEAEEPGEGAPAEGGKKKLSKKKLVLFIILPLLIFIGAGAGLYFTGTLDKILGKGGEAHDSKDGEGGEHADGDKGKDGEHAKKDDGGPGFYYDLPDIVVNLSDPGAKPRFLKLRISIEIPSKEDQPKLEAVMPRITDNFQTYLRELRVDDLRGSAGIYRLRQELLARVNTAANPVEVRDILFREILVQ